MTTYRPSEGEMELQGDRVGEGESVRAEGVTRYVAEATGADGSDVRLVLLETKPEGRRAGGRAWWEFSFSAPASPAATPTVHQGAPVVRQREDLHLEVSTRGCRLQQQTETSLEINSTYRQTIPSTFLLLYYIIIIFAIMSYQVEKILDKSKCSQNYC